MIDKLIAKYLSLPDGFKVFVAVLLFMVLLALIVSGT